MAEIWESCVSFSWGMCKFKKDQCVKMKCPYADIQTKIDLIVDKIEKMEERKNNDVCDSQPQPRKQEVKKNGTISYYKEEE